MLVWIRRTREDASNSAVAKWQLGFLWCRSAAPEHMRARYPASALRRAARKPTKPFSASRGATASESEAPAEEPHIATGRGAARAHSSASFVGRLMRSIFVV